MIDLLISSTVLIIAVIVLRWLFKNRISRRLQYALWLIVAIRLVLPIQLGTSPISIDRVNTEKLETAITNTVREPVSGPSYTVIYSQVAEEFVSAKQDIETPVIRNEIEAETARRITVPTLGEIANAIWIVGAAVMAAWFLFVNLRFRSVLKKNASEIAVPGCDIPVKVCPALTSPCLSGLFRPTVYLTESCTDDPQRLRHILAHELTHLRHGDLIWSMLRSILLCVYWFHPLVWVAAILSKRDCELACDEGALAKLGEAERIAYGKTLLDTVARRPSPNHLLETATSMNETKKQLKERVNFIVKKPKFYLILTVCVLLITAVAIGCTFTGAPDNPNWTCPCSIMVDGVQYHTYFEKAEIDTDSIVIAGHIKEQSCQASEMPTENDTSNFSICVGEPYAWVDGQLYLRCDGQWNVCVKANSQDIPETTTSPIETTEPTDPRLFNEEQLAELQTLFTGYYETRTNWYNAALLATFDSPQDIDAFDLFSVGTGNPADRRLTDEELEYLRNTMPNIGPIPEQGTIPCRMSREYVENVLDQYFGLTTADLKTADSRFTYWEKTDCYYVVSEGHAALDFRLLGARRQEDGTILFEYYYPYTDINYVKIYETVLRPVSGGYHVLSNRVIEKSNLNPKAKLENETPPAMEDLIKKLETLFGNQTLATSHRFNWYNDALRCQFASVKELDVHWIFSMAPGIPGCSDLTDAEVEYLQDFPGIKGNLSVDQPVYRIERSYVEEVLRLYFGVNPGEIEVESRMMVYWEETDCYYVAHDPGGISNLKVLRADVLSDRTIRFWYTDAGSNSSPEYFEAVIRPALGGYQIMSNLRMADYELAQRTPLAPDTRPNPLNLLAWNYLRTDNAFNFALKSAYENPADVDIYELFYDMPKVGTLTDEELAFAVSKGLNPEVSPIYRYPVSTIDSVLRRVFGIGFDECNGIGLEHFIYNKKTDCYYESHGDFESGSYTPTDMVQLADGTVMIYYNGCVNYEFLPMVVTLIPTEDSWQIVSNLPVPEPTDTSWQPTEKVSKSYDEYFSLIRQLGYQQISKDLTWFGGDGAEYTLQSMAESGLCVLSNAQEVLWTVPGTENPSGIQWLVCDGQWAYGITDTDLVRLELLTGKQESLFTGEKLLCGDKGYEAANLMVCDRSFVLFAAVNNGKGCIYRLYLPTMTLDLICDEIPADTLPCWLEIWTPEDNRYYPFMFLNPQLQPIVYDTLADPNSPFQEVIEAWPDSAEEPMIVDMGEAWKIPNLMTTYEYHAPLEWLIISLQSVHETPASVLWVYDNQENAIIKKTGMLHTGYGGVHSVQQYPERYPDIPLGTTPEELLAQLESISFMLDMPDYEQYQFPEEVNTPIKDGRTYNLTDLSFSYYTLSRKQCFTFSFEGKLQSISSWDEELPTAKGLKTGDSIKRMQQIYGTDFKKDVEDYPVYQYRIDGGYLNVFYENDRVQGWSFNTYPNINND